MGAGSELYDNDFQVWEHLSNSKVNNMKFVNGYDILQREMVRTKSIE